MQRGQIFVRHGSWHLRYRVDGKQVSQRLAPYSDEFRTLKSVRPLADKILNPVNSGHLDTLQTLQQFVESKYLPFVEQKRKPSTYHGYKKLYHRHIAPYVGGIRVASFRTKDGQVLLDMIAHEHPLSHLTLIHVKSFLSGVFAFAKRMDDFDGANPMQGTEVPKGHASEPTYAYSLEEVDKLRKALKGTARTAVTVAAYTGLSLGELQGLQWNDISGDQLRVNRTIWHGKEGPTKTEARNAAVPLLPIVKDTLVAHHKQNPGTSWVFEGPSGRPLDLGTFGSKRIKPALANGETEWHGWHALRRGLATNLHEAGVQDRIIQSLMRHSSLAVTMAHYVKATPAANIAAMQKLNASRRKK